MAKLVWTAEAERWLRRIHDYIATDKPGAAVGGQGRRETADALLRVDAYLSTQPTSAEREKGQLRDIRADGGGKSLTGLRGVGSSGRIRTYNPLNTGTNLP